VALNQSELLGVLQAGEMTDSIRSVAVVVAALVARGQGALDGEAGAVGASVLDYRCALAEPAIDVLGDADHATGGGVQLVGLVGEVAAVRGDLTGQ
jgi:hypothetical protein